ncbi:hypothetical protein [Mediterraneibacter glycyrrhizinilyticus]|nr:hypothetical protein [Mediterraneibacter glycyrrhizinilyticus]MDM8125460.1 hypothetical protein [Mediterraneibacter glycyrrhizinilyticus]
MSRTECLPAVTIENKVMAGHAGEISVPMCRRTLNTDICTVSV